MKIFGIILALILSIYLVYANAINHPFVHDDIVFIQQNPRIATLDMREIFFNISPPIHELANSYYRPVLELIYRLEYRFFGFNAAGYHAVNVGVHIANSLLVLALCLSLGFSFLFAAGIALFFGVHPVQSEAVACISGISNLAAAFFMLIALVSYARKGFILAWIAMIIGLLTKESAIMVVPLMIVMDVYLKRRPYTAWIIMIMSAFLMMFWRGMLTHHMMFASLLQNPYELFLRIMHIPTVLVHDLRIVLWPGDLHYYRNLNITTPFWPSWLLLLGVGGLAFILSPVDNADRRRYALGWVLFILSLCPVLNVIPLINEYSFVMMADHFMYFPIIGILICLGCLMRQWVLPPRRWILVVIMGILAGLGTVYQNTFWQSEVALFERMVQFEPQFGRGQALLAKAYFFNKRFVKALEHYEKAQSIFERYMAAVEDSAARTVYIGFLKDIHVEKAQAYAGLGKWDMARVEYIQALNWAPHDLGILNNLAIIFMMSSQWNEAVTLLQRILEMNAQEVATLNNLAICLHELKRDDEAIEMWQRALAVDPHFAPALNNLERLKKEKQ